MTSEWTAYVFLKHSILKPNNCSHLNRGYLRGLKSVSMISNVNNLCNKDWSLIEHSQ